MKPYNHRIIVSIKKLPIYGSLYLKYFYLVSQQVIKLITFTYQEGFTIFHHHLCRFQPGVEIAAHFKAVSTRVQYGGMHRRT